MDTLRKGDQGPQVTQLRQLLTQRGYSVPVNGVFDTRTWQAVRAFQTQNLDQHGQAPVVDGTAGRLTCWRLQNTIEGKRRPSVQGFSHVRSRMDKLRGFGQVP